MSGSTKTEEVQVYTWGLVSLSACAPADMPIEEVEQSVNRQHPTGLNWGWEFADDEPTFADDKSPNPSPCCTDESRKHYLFHC